MMELEFLLLMGLLSVAVWTDQRQQRIPNDLVIVILLLGFAVQAVLHGMGGVIDAGLGVLVGLAIFLVPYAGGGMAAGDVKLLAAVGAFLGPMPVLLAGGAAMVFGALLAGIRLAYRRYQHGERLTLTQMRSTRFPFAAAVAAGVAFVLVIRGTL
jgi:Flp pilus assembly protein protease CpaA